jgi:hypothetical protein
MAFGCNVNSGGGCHVWVMDGLAVNKFSYSSYYVHNNWGWGPGDDNGYYLSGVFDPDVFNFKNIDLGLVYR